MFTAKLAAGALAIALLAMSAPSSPSSAAPGVTPEPASVSGNQGVRDHARARWRRPRLRFRRRQPRVFRGFSSGGNRGFSSRGMPLGGGNRAMRFNGGGSRKFDGGGSRRFGRSHGVPREGFNINPRYDRGPRPSPSSPPQASAPPLPWDRIYGAPLVNYYYGRLAATPVRTSTSAPRRPAAPTGGTCTTTAATATERQRARRRRPISGWRASSPAC